MQRPALPLLDLSFLAAAVHLLFCSGRRRDAGDGVTRPPCATQIGPKIRQSSALRRHFRHRDADDGVTALPLSALALAISGLAIAVRRVFLVRLPDVPLGDVLSVEPAALPPVHARCDR